jgi:aspartate/methionine/tyrosine aminotransferase
VAGYANDTSAAAAVEPGHVIVSAGVKQALFNLSYCLFGAGDEVLVPAPYWPSYIAIVHLSGATPVMVPLDSSNDYRVSASLLEEYRTDRTRGLLLNSPSNPTGAVTGREDLSGILDWAARNDIWVLSDEIYRRLSYSGGSAPSVLDFPDRDRRVVALDGMSKAFSMPGWRIGWAIGDQEVMAKASALQSQTTSGAAVPSQFAAAALLDSAERESIIAEFRSTLDRRRQQSLAGLQGVPGIEVREQPGAIYHYIRLLDDNTSMATAEALLTRAGVAAIPGEAFGTPGFLRITFAGADDALAEGVRRIAGFFS